ncbi:hypothetical protein OU426_05140 [Frigidibacter sp. RF13]|uniref:hypothetical protein n=1 Tax=Frigidibacter sp. RF13 TaxID=2997340 RepID=UPI0022710597|nr:hypothetical protein [Frigidibacter sp. RF13]MCY1126233.1 hypothetical protein [Frigidibacter sp. RF13]
MRPFPQATLWVALVAALNAAGPARADLSLSQEIGANGLAATEVRLAALAAPTPEETFALAGVRFLHVVEVALQTQAREGIYDASGVIPFARLALQAPHREGPMRPEAMADLLKAANAGLDAARAPLDSLPPDADFGLEIALGDLWFDIDGDDARAPEESLYDILGPELLGWRWSERDPAAPIPTVRFDAADAHWLRAYTHLLGGVTDVILAYDPTDGYRRVLESHAAFENLSPLPPPDPENYNFLTGFGATVDSVAPLFWALRQEPDRDRLLSAHGHFLAMIADNRLFWQAVALETDDDGEWLPNDRQKAALGIDLPQGTGERWLAVLADAEALLKGEKLVPYWRLGPEAGVNIGKLFTDPRPVDFVGWIQGADALPYLEKGPLVSGESWAGFERMLSGNSLMMALYLN